MKPSIAVICAWLLFAGSHLLLSSSSLREHLMNRFGPLRFTVIYTAIATLSLLLLIVMVALYGGIGLPGPGLARFVLLKWVLTGVALIGMALMTAGLANYPRSAIAQLARRQRSGDQNKPLATPTVLEQFTRHPFFVGLILLTVAHALLAYTLAQAVYFAGFAVLAGLGMVLQDRKLLRRYGGLYQAYIDATSGKAWLAGPMGLKIARSRLPMALIVAAITLIAASLHSVWRLGNGAALAALILLGGLYAVIRQAQRAR